MPLPLIRLRLSQLLLRKSFFDLKLEFLILYILSNIDGRDNVRINN